MRVFKWVAAGCVAYAAACWLAWRLLGRAADQAPIVDCPDELEPGCQRCWHPRHSSIPHTCGDVRHTCFRSVP